MNSLDISGPSYEVLEWHVEEFRAPQHGYDPLPTVPNTLARPADTDPLPLFGGEALFSIGSIADGTYCGGNHRLALELRVDFDGSGVISGDVFGTSFGGRDLLGSFRTVPGVIVAFNDPQPWKMIFESQEGGSVTGRCALEPSLSDGTVTCRLLIQDVVPGLPSGQWFDLIAEWQSAHLRRISVEMEQETGTQGSPTETFNGRQISLQSVLGDAGIDVVERAGTDFLPKPEGGWGQTQILTNLLDRGAVENGDGPMNTPAWKNQLLWLDQPTRAGLFGLRFDASAHLAHQSAAVFEGEIHKQQPQDANQQIIRTAAHEIGHALNLAHRFDRNVGRAESHSIMNCDQRYRGGGLSREYWQKFRFEFDKDELEFLRHGARHNVMPGSTGHPCVRYWADGSGGYQPYLPAASLDGWVLDLSAPTQSYLFGQPVFMQVSLTNKTGRVANLDPRILDPKGSYLSVLVRRVRSGPFDAGQTLQFRPIMERCYGAGGVALETIIPNGSLTNNIQISFGADGFTFAEPGDYEIRVVGAVPDQNDATDPRDDLEQVVVSKPLRIRVQYPHSRIEEAEATHVLLRPDVGTYFAMGGAYALEKAHDDLKEVCARRLARRMTVSDPIAAAIVRCQGIDIGRRYERIINGKHIIRDADPQEAARLLSQVTQKNTDAFDEATRASTARLLERHRKHSASA